MYDPTGSGNQTYHAVEAYLEEEDVAAVRTGNTRSANVHRSSGSGGARGSDPGALICKALVVVATTICEAAALPQRRVAVDIHGFGSCRKANRPRALLVQQPFRRAQLPLEIATRIVREPRQQPQDVHSSVVAVGPRAISLAVSLDVVVEPK